MQLFLFLITVVTGTFLLAGIVRNHGWYLADQLCAQGAMLCDNPLPLMIVAFVLTLIVTLRLAVKT